MGTSALTAKFPFSVFRWTKRYLKLTVFLGFLKNTFNPKGYISNKHPS